MCNINNLKLEIFCEPFKFFVYIIKSAVNIRFYFTDERVTFKHQIFA